MEIAPVPGIRAQRPMEVRQGAEELAPAVAVQPVRKMLEDDSYSGSGEGGGNAASEPEQGISREQLARARTRARKAAAAYGEPTHHVDFYV